MEISDPESTIRPSLRSNKKQKTQLVPDENGNRSSRGQRSAKKRKPDPEPEAEDSGNDVDMTDVNEILQPLPQPIRRSLNRSLADAAPVKKNDQSCSAVAESSHASVSPFRHMVRSSASQTDEVAVYEREYISLLEESHRQALQSKEEELADQRKKIASLSSQVLRLETDLRKERERATAERGWKKHF